MQATVPTDGSMAPKNFGDLPRELIFQVARYLRAPDMSRLSQTSRSLYYLLKQEVERAGKAFALADQKEYEKYIIQDQNGLHLTGYSSPDYVLEPLAEDIMNQLDRSASAFINLGVDPNSYTLKGVRMLNLALNHFQEGIAELLLQKGADPLLSDIGDGNETPLRCAARSASDRMVRILLEAGADPRTPSVIHEIVRYCTLETVQLIVAKGADIFEIHAEEGSTVLHWAVKNPDEKVVQFLLTSGLDTVVSHQDNAGETCLWNALETVNKAVIETILDSGINVHLRNQYGETALHQAAYQGQEYAVRRLLDARVRLSRQGACGRTELHYAIISGNIDIVAMLLNAGSNPRLLTDQWDSIIHTAAVMGFKNILKGLLHLFPDMVDMRNNARMTAEQLCRHLGRTEIADIIRDFKNSNYYRVMVLERQVELQRYRS